MDVIINASSDSLPNPPRRCLSKTVVTQRDFLLNTLVQLGQNKTHTPLADFLRTSYRLPAGKWLIVSPIHWQATHNDALITAHSDALSLDEATARRWFDQVAQFLAQDDLTLVYHSPTIWLLNTEGKPALSSPNLAAIHHQSLMPILREWDSTLYWQRLFTELQMFCASHPLNNVLNQPVRMNGVWFWGGGQLVVDAEKYKRPVVSDCPLIQSVLACHGFDKEVTPVSDDILYTMGSPTVDLLEKLIHATRKKTGYWYWNDVAYLVKRTPWYRFGF
jgi:hypothetical protein